MSSFFGPPPDLPDEMSMESPKWGPPLWDRAAEDTLGVSVGVSVVLAVTDDHALVFDNVRAFPNGFTFDLVQIRNPNIPIDLAEMGQRPRFSHGPRLGFEFSDGSIATTETPGVANRPGIGGRGRRWSSVTLSTAQPASAFDDDGIPIGHVLRMQGGGGGQHRQTSEFWCFGLPSAGTMTVHADWPDHFDEVAIDIDATPIIEAAARSRILWDRT